MNELVSLLMNNSLSKAAHHVSEYKIEGLGLLTVFNRIQWEKGSTLSIL